MLDTQTKRRIDDCRDILVGKLPDPKAQIEQITIGLIYKFMDDMDKEAIELGGQAKFFSDYKVPDPEFPNDRSKDKVVEFSKYAWDKLLHPKVTASEMLTLYSEAIEGMEKNPNIPQLFRDIFNNAYLPYRDPETLKLFLKTIGEFEYTHSEKLGDAFEYLLSVMGSQGDAGQFRTPRHIIDFLVAIIDPDKNDTILDPACGTAGFLISAFKHILLKYSKDNKESLNIFQYNQLEKKPFNNLGDKLTPDDRKKLIQNFVGYDISPDMVRLSLVNLYLHGFNTPNIHEYDTLSSEDRWNETADVILANPPFMSPKGGIRPHKKFSISSNRSEVLFVDYIAEHLNLKGKAGVIVPEGIIFQGGTAYKDLRKMLVENYLYAVVSLPAGVFNPYSGVKTSIILMDKEVSRKRDAILFVKIDNDGFNLGANRTAVKGSQLTEAVEIIKAFVKFGEFTDSSIAHIVLKSIISDNVDYNLSGEKYKIEERFSQHFDMIEIKSVADVASGYGFPVKYQGNIDYKYPFYKVSDMNLEGNDIYMKNHNNTINDEILTELNAKTFPQGTVIFPKIGAAIATNKKRILTRESLYDNNVMGIIPYSDKLDSLYLFYLLQSINISDWASESQPPSMRKTTVEDYKIPLPPLFIQKEIVAEIESYQKIIVGAKSILSSYKPKISFNPDWKYVKLGEYVSIDNGRVLTNFDDTTEKNVACIKVSDMNLPENQIEIVTTSHWLARTEYQTLEVNSIVFPKRGAAIATNKKRITRIPCLIDNNCMGISSINKQVLNPEFLFFFMLGFDLTTISNSAGIALINNGDIMGVEIPLPSIEEQLECVKKLQKEMELVNANKLLVEIFEQKIEDKIDKVWGE